LRSRALGPSRSAKALTASGWTFLAGKIRLIAPVEAGLAQAAYPELTMPKKAPSATFDAFAMKPFIASIAASLALCSPVAVDGLPLPRLPDLAAEADVLHPH